MDDLRTTAVGGCVSAPGINPGLSLGVGIPRMGSSSLCSPNPMTGDGSFFPNSSTQFQQSFHGNVSSNQAYVHVTGITASKIARCGDRGIYKYKKGRKRTDSNMPIPGLPPQRQPTLCNPPPQAM